MKIYVFDASALFTFLLKKTDSNKVSALLEDALYERTEIFMSAVNCGEVYGSILRQHGRDRAISTISSLATLPIHLMEATVQRAMQAADVKHKYKLYYADSFAASLAIEYKATLVTGDSDFRRLGHGFPVMWLKA